MNTRLPSINTKLSNLVAVLGVLWCLVVNPLKAENIVGDTVPTNLTVQGNALITGNLQAQGYELKLGQNGTNPGISINFVPASGSDPSEVQFLQSENANKGEWVWALKPSSGADKIQMVLGADNFLSIYAINYSSGAPNSGKIVISPNTSGSSISIDGSVVLTEAVGDSRYLTPGDADVTYMTRTTADGLYVSSDNFNAAVVTLEDEFGSMTGPTIALSEGIATAPYSFAGLSAHATGLYSTATGYMSNASGRYSIAAGFYSTASGEGSTATGFYSTASGISSTATGYGTTASEIYSTATGHGSIASGPYSTASGPYSIASGDSTISAGNHTTATGAFQFVIGSYNIAQGDPSYWVPTDDLFVIGNGVDDYTRSNALIVKKNGETTLFGTADPSAPVIVLDPNNSQITINGEPVLTSDSAASTYLTASSGDGLYLRKDATNISVGTGSTVDNSSIVLGSYQTATGTNALALGTGNGAFGNYATMVGASNSASYGDYATALGVGNFADGNNSLAVGKNNNSIWDNAITLGIGNTVDDVNGLALGINNYSYGDKAIAFGSNNSSNGNNSLALGTGNTSNVSSVALGSGNTALINSMALGTGNYAGDDSLVVGFSNSADSSATIFGIGNTIEGPAALVLGGGNNVSGDGDMVFGVANSVTGFSAMTLGLVNSATGDFSSVLGYSSTAQSRYSLVLGVNNVVQGSPTDWVATDDMLVVGNGGNGPTPSNAFAIHKNGNTRIAGQLEARGVIRCAKAGDLDMGVFTDGANPADATNGLNAGLRYATE